MYASNQKTVPLVESRIGVV